MLNNEDISKLADRLIGAEKEKQPIPPLVDQYDLTISDAYKIQLEVVEMKREKGEACVGKKIGLTSKSMQRAFNVDQPDYGHIMSAMVLNEGSPIRLSELIQPKIEAEIGFLLDKDLVGPGITAPEVLRCTAGVLPTFEVIDSRIVDWNIKIEDSIADNASIGKVILGAPMWNVDGLDMRTVGMVVKRNGEIVQTAAGAEVLGNPAQSVAWLANKLSEYGIQLNEGEIILSGSAVSPLELEAGDTIGAMFGNDMGSVETYVRE